MPLKGGIVASVHTTSTSRLLMDLNMDSKSVIFYAYPRGGGARCAWD